MTQRRLALLVLLAAIGVYAYLQWRAIQVTRESAEIESFNRLVRYVAQHGQQEQPSADLFRLLKLPTEGDTVQVRSFTATPTSEQAKADERAIIVRERDGSYDVLLMLTYPDRAYAFLVDEYGKLLKATMLDPEPRKMNDPVTLFGDEWLFWLEAANKLDTRKSLLTN